MDGSLLYVSRRTCSDDDVRNIVETSLSWNARLHITGALVASRNRFAQILEGSRAGVDEPMEGIRRDPRGLTCCRTRTSRSAGFPSGRWPLPARPTTSTVWSDR